MRSGEEVEHVLRLPVPARVRRRSPPRPASHAERAYSHLLGLYLGDGHVIRLGRTFMLRNFFDARYPGLIGEAVRTVRAVAPDQRVAVFRKKPSNFVILRCYWNR